MDKKGFTLIELLITVAIIGILAAIAIPAYVGQQKRAARSEAYSNLQNLRLLEEQYFAENACYSKNSSGACANLSFSSIGGIQGFLPGFKPGDDAGLNYTYSIQTSTWSSMAAGGFTATATGRDKTRVKGDNFWIDNSNNRNW